MKQREERRRGTVQQDRSARTRKGKQASERVTTRGPLASSNLALPRSVVPDVDCASPGSEPGNRARLGAGQSRQARSRAIAPMVYLWCLAWMIRCVGKQRHACRASDLAFVGQGCRANDLASAGHAHPCETLPRLARSSANQPTSQPASTPARFEVRQPPRRAWNRQKQTFRRYPLLNDTRHARREQC